MCLVIETKMVEIRKEETKAIYRSDLPPMDGLKGNKSDPFADHYDSSFLSEGFERQHRSCAPSKQDGSSKHMGTSAHTSIPSTGASEFTLMKLQLQLEASAFDRYHTCCMSVALFGCSVLV